MNVGVYLRVSTDKQTVENQRDLLASFCEDRGWEPEWFLDEGVSGSQPDRPAYQDLIDAARKGRIEAVVCYKLDRLSRSMSQLVTDVERFNQWGVDVVTYDQRIDTTNQVAGKLQLAVFSALAEIESDIISERTKDAYQRLKQNGNAERWGRPRKQVPEFLIEAVAEGEMTQVEAAEQAKVSRTTIARRVDEFEPTA